MICLGSMQGEVGHGHIHLYVVVELCYETACIEVHVFWSSFGQGLLSIHITELRHRK